MRRFWLTLTTAYLVCFVVGFALLLFAPGLALAQVAADSLGSVIPPSGPISTIGTTLIGVGASLLTGLVATGARGADGFLGNLDGGVRKAIGPALPLVTAGFSIALPLISNALHLSSVPDAAVILNAPASAIVGIAAREALRKWLLPLVARRPA